MPHLKPTFSFKNVQWQIARFAEIKWWINYLEEKDPADYYHWKKAYWINFLESSGLDIDDYRTGEVIDVGCGPAGIAICGIFKRLDLLDPHLAKYSRRFSQLWAYNQYLDAYATSIEQFIPKKKYTLVFAINALNHFSSLQKSLHILKSCIQSEGKLLISIDVHRNKFLSLLFQAIPLDILHPHQHTDKGYRKIFKKAGFECLESRSWKRKFIFEEKIYLLKPLPRQGP